MAMTSDERRSGREVLEDASDWLSASDPGLNRLRMAVRGVVAMGTTLGIEWLFARHTGASSQNALIAMLLGAIVAMMGSMGLSSGSAAQRATTAALFPASMGIGMAVGAAVAQHTDLLLGVFVVVLFVAVYVRRFGQRFFFAGFMVWIGYFFASFLGATFGQLPWLVLYTVVAAGWVLVLSLTVLQENLERTLRHTLKAFTTRAEALAAAAAAVLETDQERARRRLARQQRRLNEAALMIEGQLGADSAVPEGWSAAALRRGIVDAQLALEEVALAAPALASCGAGPGVVPAARDMLGRIAAGRPEAASVAADTLDARAMDDGDDVRHATRRMSAAMRSYADWYARWSVAGRPPGVAEDEQAGPEEFTSSVTMMMGRLPSSNAVARDVPARSAGWNPLARLPLTTRQAIQVAIAGGLAIAAGRALSSQRYYWAIIAAFIAFTGTATRAETFIKAANRVVGTAAGLGVAILLANLTAGRTDAVLAVILASMFFGFYLQQISYAFMIFFITIMVAQLYSVLHEFSDHLLVLRLEETAIGAGIGILVALLVMPVSTRDTSRAARTNFYTGLQELLETAADQLGDSRQAAEKDPDKDPDKDPEKDPDKDLDGLARTVDGHLHQLSQILAPLTTPLALRSDADRIRRRLALYTLAATAARGLASAVRHAPAARPPALATACRCLARAAELLADRDDPEQPLAAAGDCLQAAQAALDAADDSTPTGADDDIAHLRHATARLLHTMRGLAGGPRAARVPAA